MLHLLHLHDTIISYKVIDIRRDFGSQIQHSEKLTKHHTNPKLMS